MATKKSTKSAMLPPAPPERPPLDLKALTPAQPELDPAVPDPSQPITGQEFAVSLESYYTRFELYQYNPDELITKKGLRILEKMATSDDTIAMGLTALKMMRLASGYEIVQASDDPLDVQIADEVADNFDLMQGSLREKIFSILGSLEMGWSLHEKIWDFWEDGPWKGHVRLKTLKSKNPQWFNPTVDDFNNITGLAMISPPAFGRKLPHQKFLIYSAQKRYENVFGTSRIRCLYDMWYLKGIAKATLAVLLKKYGKETPMGFYPMTMSSADRTAFLSALTNMATSAAALFPEGTKIDFAKLEYSTVQGCLAVIEKADQQMTKILLGQVMSSGTSAGQSHKGGSQAGGGAAGGKGGGGGQVQEQTLNMYLQYIGDDVCENPFAELIKEIVDANYEGVQKYPRLKFKSMSDEDQSAAITTWSACVAAGTVTSSDDDEEHIREALGFPSASGKTTLRPNRFKTKAKPRVVPARPPIDPKKFPIAGTRPPTPSAAGLPANYAEGEWKPPRDLTKYEEGVDFAESWKIVDTEGEDVIAAAAAQVIRKAVEKLKLQAKKALGDSAQIRKMTMPYRGELAGVLRDGLQEVAERAMTQARREIRAKQSSDQAKRYAELQAKRYAEIHNLEGLQPEEVLKLINDKSFTMAGDVSDEVLKKVKTVLYNGVKTGASYSDTVYKIEDAIAPYIDLTAADDELSGSRLMNAVRTNVAGAYNDARKSIFEDPDLEGFVLAYQFSAIMDGDTTDWCAGMDGKIFKVSNPIWDEWTPPTYWQCRSTLVPITQVDDWDGEESDEPKDAPPEGFN